MAKISIKTPKGWLRLKTAYDLVKENGYQGSEEQFASTLKDLVSISSQPVVPKLIQLYSSTDDNGDVLLNPALGPTDLSETLSKCTEPTVIKCLLCNPLKFTSNSIFKLNLGNQSIPIRCLDSQLSSESWKDISSAYEDYGFESGDIIELCICNSNDIAYVHLLTTPYRTMEKSLF